MEESSICLAWGNSPLTGWENESQEKRLNLEYQEKARQGGEGRKREARIQPHSDTDGEPVISRF